MIDDLFQNYKAAVLDSALFASGFSLDMKLSLSALKKIYVSTTFMAEIEQYKAVLPDDKLKTYNHNLSYISNCALITTSFDTQSADAGDLNNDIWGILSVFSDIRAKVVLITSNKLLIRRVILHELAIDIYDLNENCFILSNYFGSLKEKYEFNDEQEEIVVVLDDGQVIKARGQYYLPAPDKIPSESSRVFLSNGTVVQLGKSFNSGLEADLYHIEDGSKRIAKIYKKGNLSLNKFKHIQNVVGMNAMAGISWAQYPDHLIYADEEHTMPVGLVENYVETEMNLDDDLLYLGDLDLPKKILKRKVSSSVELCLKIVRQVMYLGSCGFCVCDFNTGNFAYIKGNNRAMQMWDTDSFGYERYFAPYCAGQKSNREYDFSKSIETIDFCTDALLLFAFSILSLGDSPVSDVSGKFKYDNPKYFASYRKAFFPKNLWNMFESVFRGEKLPSAETLLYELYVAWKHFEEVPGDDMSYAKLLHQNAE